MAASRNPTGDRKRDRSTLVAVIGGIAAILAAATPLLIARCPKATSAQPATDSTTSAAREPTSEELKSRPEHEPSDGVVDDIWEVTTVAGEDDAGRQASFRFLVVSQAFEWGFARSDVVIRTGKEQDFTLHLRTPGIQATMNRAKALIAVGASSQEGGDRLREESRALERADQIELWLSEYVTSDVPLESLTLGQYVARRLPEPSSRTGVQRRLVIIAVKSQASGTNIEQALKSAIQKNAAPFPFDIDEYSKFEILPRR